MWNDISHRRGVHGNHFPALNVKIDRKGDDKKVNAQLFGMLRISVILAKIKKISEIASKYKKTHQRSTRESASSRR